MVDFDSSWTRETHCFVWDNLNQHRKRDFGNKTPPKELVKPQRCLSHDACQSPRQGASVRRTPIDKQSVYDLVRYMGADGTPRVLDPTHGRM